MKKFNKRIKKFDVHDIQLINLSIAAFVLFVLNIWPAAMTWVAGVHWGWFLGAMIIFALRPFKRVWLK